MTHGANGTSPSRLGHRQLTVFTPARTPARLATGRLLPGRAGRSETTVHGGPSVVVGAGLLLAGLLLLGAATRVLGAGVVTVRVPAAAGIAVALSVALLGVSFVSRGRRGLSRRRRVRRLRANHPREPWLWEHPWNAFASFDETRDELRRGVPAIATVALFLLPFHWLASGGGEVRWAFAVVTALFDVALLFAAGRLVHLALRLRRYGTAELRLPRFPCVTGSAIELKLVRTPEIAELGTLRGTLRCLQDRYEERRSSRTGSRVVVVHALHESTVTGETSGGGEAVVFRFDVPGDLPGSALDERPPRYWEVEIEGEAAGVDFGARFLVPIYAPR